MDERIIIEMLADIQNELARLHTRMDMWESTISQLAEAVKANPMLKALIPNGFKVS